MVEQWERSSQANSWIVSMLDRLFLDYTKSKWLGKRYGVFDKVSTNTDNKRMTFFCRAGFLCSPLRGATLASAITGISLILDLLRCLEFSGVYIFTSLAIHCFDDGKSYQKCDQITSLEMQSLIAVQREKGEKAPKLWVWQSQWQQQRIEFDKGVCLYLAWPPLIAVFEIC